MNRNQQQSLQSDAGNKPGVIFSEKVIIALLQVVLALGMTYLQLNDSTPQSNSTKGGLEETQLDRFI